MRGGLTFTTPSNGQMEICLAMLRYHQVALNMKSTHVRCEGSYGALKGTNGDSDRSLEEVTPATKRGSCLFALLSAQSHMVLFEHHGKISIDRIYVFFCSRWSWPFLNIRVWRLLGNTWNTPFLICFARCWPPCASGKFLCHALSSGILGPPVAELLLNWILRFAGKPTSSSIAGCECDGINNRFLKKMIGTQTKCAWCLGGAMQHFLWGCWAKVQTLTELGWCSVICHSLREHS